MSLDGIDPPTDLPTLSLAVNGQDCAVTASPAARLSEVLRGPLGCTDVKIGCNAGDCGACTVLLDGQPVCACTTAIGQAAGRRVETLTGLVEAGPLAADLAAAMTAHQAAQCGICTPGVMVSAVALLRETPAPTPKQAADALGGVLCRCTGYRKIIDAVCTVGSDLSAVGPTEARAAVGAAMPRLDSAQKVEGREIFSDDAAPSDALSLRLVRSPHPHAAFRFGDLRAYQAAHPEISLVLTAEDIPGLNRFGVIPAFTDQPAFAENVARFRGEAVAAVVGEASAIEALDLTAFPVTFEKLQAALSPEDALKADAPLVHQGCEGNVMCRGLVQRGDVDAGLAAGDICVDGTFSTRFVEHAYIEPEAGYAERIGDRLHVHGGTQAPMMDRDSLAEILALAPEAIRIVPTATGGGFGAKLDLSFQPYVALAAWRLGRAVRVTYTRAESMQSTTKRHPGQMTARLACKADGTVSGFGFQGDFNTGAYASWGPTVANRVPVHASGPYLIPAYRAETRAIHTHCPPAGAFRGFGVPQAAIAQEQLFDEAAERLGIDKLAFRLKNALRNGQPTVTGQVFEQGVGIAACFEALAPHWQRARAEAETARADTGPLRRGVGIAAGWYGCGNTSLPNPSTIKAGITAEGRVVLHQGAVDIGQGANTVIAQIFADALGVPVDALSLVGADTDITPDAGKTSASRQTFVTGNAAKRAGEALRAEILRRANVSAAARIELSAGALLLDEGGERRRIDLAAVVPDGEGYVLRAEESYDPPTRPLDADGQGVPYAVFGYAAHMVELNVDIRLGTVTLVKLTAAHDVGRAINPLLIEGQVHGGIAQGVGMALMEEFIPGRTENLHDYLIPTFGDIPPVETLIVEEEDAHGPFGAKGLGEHVLIPTAPAILNAIADATGARIRDIPATPDRVLSAIQAKEGVR
ncbi:MAG: molybdopterin cofactor-binding domain-containing protein [Pseudomonadota bacterium]